MQWNGLESPVLIIASLLIALQVCWIGAVLRRNQRRRLGDLSAHRRFSVNSSGFFQEQMDCLDP